MNLKEQFEKLIEEELGRMKYAQEEGEGRANRIAALARAAAIVQELRAGDVVDARTAEELEKSLGNGG